MEVYFDGLDAGLSPAEVGRPRTPWIDTDNQLLRILGADIHENNSIVRSYTP